MQINIKKSLFNTTKKFCNAKSNKKKKDGSFEEYQKSVELTNLRDKKGIREYLANLENLGTIFFNAIRHFKNEEGKWVLEHTSEVDVLSSTGLGLMKGILKRKVKNYNNKLLVKMAKFLITNRKFDDMLWFTRDVSEIKRIFNENLEILKRLKVDMSSFNIEEQNSFVEWVNDKDVSLNGEDSVFESF